MEKTKSSFREYLREINNINENNNSDRDFIDNRLKTTFGKEGFKLPKNGPTVKIGYTLWPFAGGFEVINDGVSIKVKKDGKELAYFDKPKLDYKKAVNFLIKSMKDLDEGEKLISEKLDYKTFFAQKLEKYSVSSPAELSDEDKKKFFDEIEAEWEGEKEEKPKADDVNEADWDDAKNAVHELANIFKRGKSRITSNNSINIEVRGIVGKVVFDPSYKL